MQPSTHEFIDGTCAVCNKPIHRYLGIWHHNGHGKPGDPRPMHTPAPVPTDDDHSKAVADLHAESPEEGDTRDFNYRHQIFKGGRWVDDLSDPRTRKGKLGRISQTERDLAAQREGRPVGPESNPPCPCCKSTLHVGKSPKPEFGEFFCPCNEPGPQYFNRDGSGTSVTPDGPVATPAPGPCANPLALAIGVLEAALESFTKNLHHYNEAGLTVEAQSCAGIMVTYLDLYSADEPLQEGDQLQCAANDRWFNVGPKVYGKRPSEVCAKLFAGAYIKFRRPITKEPYVDPRAGLHSDMLESQPFFVDLGNLLVAIGDDEDYAQHPEVDEAIARIYPASQPSQARQDLENLESFGCPRRNALLYVAWKTACERQNNQHKEGK